MDKSAILCCIAEFIGTFLLVFLGCMGCIMGDAFSNSLFQMGFNFGLVVMAMVQIFGYISIAHINPAVTLAGYVYNQLSISKAIGYFFSQMLGATLGYGLLITLIPSYIFEKNENTHGLCVTAVHPDINVFQGLVIEFILTSVLILLCCAVWDPRNAANTDSIPIRFGLTVSMLSLTGGSFTGTSMNPARSFGPALWNNDFQDHWIYWIGPLSSALLVSVGFKTFYWREVDPASVDN